MTHSYDHRPFFRVRAFCAAFFLTLCVFLAGGGFLLADFHSREATFGDGPIAYAEAGGDSLRDALSFVGTGNTQPQAALIWPPARVICWILEGERTLFGWILTAFC